MKKLTLHEAIELVLKVRQNRTWTINEIANEINSRKLYEKKDKSALQSGQVRLRTHPNTKAGKFYSYMFEYIEPDKVRLR